MILRGAHTDCFGGALIQAPILYCTWSAVVNRVLYPLPLFLPNKKLIGNNELKGAASWIDRISSDDSFNVMASFIARTWSVV